MSNVVYHLGRQNADIKQHHIPSTMHQRNGEAVWWLPLITLTCETDQPFLDLEDGSATSTDFFTLCLWYKIQVPSCIGFIDLQGEWYCLTELGRMTICHHWPSKLQIHLVHLKLMLIDALVLSEKEIFFWTIPNLLCQIEHLISWLIPL